MAEGLDNSSRLGAEKDEPEGSRWIQLSDTLAREFAADLREIASIQFIEIIDKAIEATRAKEKGA
jgi:hypothetical protein